VYSTFPTCCLEAEEDLGFFDESSRGAITPDRLPMELWSLSATVSSRVINLVFYRDIIYVINILYL
jgi:hypothetical protein